MILPVIDDENFVMISALQHYLFCKRQCALIHLEQSWSENRLTASGRVLHEHVDERKSETRRSLRQATAVRLVSRKLGVVGIADMVEFHLMQTERDAEGKNIAAVLSGLPGFWRPFPVEYKRGHPKPHRADEVQLCVQAMCLEEMLNVNISCGALFYGEQRRRTEVIFNKDLRHLTEEIARGVHDLFNSGITPKPVFGKWCKSCSFIEECQPKLIASGCSARKWLDLKMEEALE